MIFTDSATKLLAWGIVIHFICDWPLQNDYLAQHKCLFVGPRDYLTFLGPAPEGEGPLFLLPHPAAFIHAGIHLVGLLLIFPWYAAIIIAIIHLIIDTRKPIKWWSSIFKQTTTGPVAIDVAIWTDQVFHIATIAIAALIVGR